MKIKRFLLAFGLIAVLVIAGCSSDKDTAENKDPVNYVTPAEVLTKIENKETFAFILGDETCSACQHYSDTTLKEMQKESDITLDFIELFEIEEREEEFEDLLVLINEHLHQQFEATPTTYFIVDGELVDGVIGAISYDELLPMYESHINNNQEDLEEEIIEEDLEEEEE